MIQYNVDIVKSLVSRQFFTIRAFFTIQHVFNLLNQIWSTVVVYYIHFFTIHFLLYPRYTVPLKCCHTLD